MVSRPEDIRAEKCWTDIKKVLEEHQCDLIVEPRVFLTQDGDIRVSSSVKIVPMPTEKEK